MDCKAANSYSFPSLQLIIQQTCSRKLYSTLREAVPCPPSPLKVQAKNLAWEKVLFIFPFLAFIGTAVRRHMYCWIAIPILFLLFVQILCSHRLLHSRNHLSLPQTDDNIPIDYYRARSQRRMYQKGFTKNLILTHKLYLIQSAGWHLANWIPPANLEAMFKPCPLKSVLASIFSFSTHTEICPKFMVYWWELCWCCYCFQSKKNNFCFEEKKI